MAGPTRWREIEEQVRALCVALPAGSLLPSEVDLAEQFGVSRMTARQAMQNLAQAGLVERRRGAGTFVAPDPLHREDRVLHSFTEDMARRGLTASSSLLSAATVAAGSDAAVFGLSPEAQVVVIRRIRYADGVPLALERAVLPGEFAAVLDTDLEAGSLHTTLAALGRTMAFADSVVSARLATDDDCELLDLIPPAALLIETRTIRDRENRVVERAETAYVASRWVIDTGAFVAPPHKAAPIAPAQGPS